jgi:menaquinone-dependent protoporphyrinogen oxidase
MHVLVAHASRHNATAQMAEAIAAVLREPGDDDPRPSVDVSAVDDVDDVESYDAVVLGSAVYEGRWLPAALLFAAENEAILSSRPVWLFSSGPVGEHLSDLPDAEDLSALTESLDARGSRTFAGRLRAAELQMDERAVVRRVHAAEGDYRDWHEIRTWAEGIRDALAATATDV